MATSSSSTETEGVDLLEFCLKSWTALEGNSLVTEVHTTHAGRVAYLLTSAKRFQAFDRFVGSIHEDVLNVFLKNEDFRRALIDLRRHQGRHEEVCQLIKDGIFSDGADLVEAWDDAQYALWQQQYGKPLSALARFRIRKRNPPPLSVCKDGRSTRSLDSDAKSVLWDWLRDHQACPYPSLAQREQLSQETGLTHTQIRTWFANARRRPAKETSSETKRRAVPRRKALRQSGHRLKNALKNSSARSVELVPTPVGESQPRVGHCIQTTVPPGSGSEYLQLSPGGVPSTCESTGLQGLICMYNRLPPIQPPIMGIPGSPISSSSSQPLLYSYEQVPLRSPPRPVTRGGVNSRCIPAGHPCYAVRGDLIGPVLIQTQQLPGCGEGEGELNGGGGWDNQRGDVPMMMVTAPTWKTTTVSSPTGSSPATSPSWKCQLEPTPLLWHQAEPTFVLNREFSGQFPQTASSRSAHTARKWPVVTTTEALTAIPASALSQATSVRMVSPPVETYPAGGQSSGAFTGMTVPVEVTEALIRDQCVAMWNASAWLTAHSPSAHRLADVTSVDNVSDLLHPDIHPTETQTDGLSGFPATTSALRGELSLPKAPDTFLFMHRTPK
ncbi:hypothetical protein ACOMHN_026463 [Nucella lapillus]